MPQIYFDHNATTIIRPEVIDLVAKIMTETGNASSVHNYGRHARKYVEKAREQTAKALNAKTSQVIFNAGATEANNTVLKNSNPQKIWISAVEHASVANAAPEAKIIPVTEDGLVDLVALKDMLEKEAETPELISVMLVNSETGVIQPVKEIVDLIKTHNPDIKVHSDCTQAIGRIPVDIKQLGIDYMSISAHKFGGPQGVGALILGPCAEAPKLIFGGAQENRNRAGTENVAGIAGMGQAIELAVQDMDHYQSLTGLRDKIQAAFLDAVPNIIIYSGEAPRVANTLSLSWPGQQASMLLMNFDLEGIAISTGSACSSGSMKASAVLKAMGANEDAAKGALRVSLGWNTSEEEVDRFIDCWQKIVARVKKAA